MKDLLSDAIDAYARFRGSQDYSHNTLQIEKSVMKRFLAVNGNIYCHSLTPRHVERHFEEASKVRSPASLQNDHVALNGFFKWARHTGRMAVDVDPMYGRRRPRGMKKERDRIPVSRFPELLDAAEERSPRDRALVALLLYTLGRDSEVTNIRIRDVDLAGGWIKVFVKKGNREDTLPICAELDRELRRWMTHYTERSGRLEPHWFLTPARDNRPVVDQRTRQFIRHEANYKPEKQIRQAGLMVVPVLESIGFATRAVDGKSRYEGAHTIRRSGARALFDSLVNDGYDHSLRIVQALLHHANMSQTESYIGVTADKRTRDDILRGKQMYATPKAENVVRILST